MSGWGSKPVWPSDDQVVNAFNEHVETLEKKWPDQIKDFKYTDTATMDEPLATKKEYFNLPPTHDPYTNPNAQLYYECKCGAILDPGTKSFASLNNAASDQGWKVRWKSDGMGYEPFCVECGKDVPE